MGTFACLPVCLPVCLHVSACLPAWQPAFVSLPSSAWIKFIFECREIIAPAPFSGTTSITYLRVAFLTFERETKESLEENNNNNKRGGSPAETYTLRHRAPTLQFLLCVNCGR